MIRKDWIDIVKGIGIALVVIGHTRLARGFLCDWIYSFHMPLFFIMAGFCFDESRYPDWKSYFIRKLKALFVPYIILSLFVIAFMSFLYWGKDPQFETIALLKNMLSGGTIGAFWFICVLFQVELLFAIIVRTFFQLKIQILVCVISFSIATSLQGCRLPYFLMSRFYRFLFMV